MPDGTTARLAFIVFFPELQRASPDQRPSSQAKSRQWGYPFYLAVYDLADLGFGAMQLLGDLSCCQNFVSVVSQQESPFPLQKLLLVLVISQPMHDLVGFTRPAGLSEHILFIGEADSQLLGI